MVVIENWDFLITEMAVLLGLAALVGLIAGLIMGSGRRKARRRLHFAACLPWTIQTIKGSS